MSFVGCQTWNHQMPKRKFRRIPQVKYECAWIEIAKLNKKIVTVYIVCVDILWSAQPIVFLQRNLFMLECVNKRCTFVHRAGAHFLYIQQGTTVPIGLLLLLKCVDRLIFRTSGRTGVWSLPWPWRDISKFLYFVIFVSIFLHFYISIFLFRYFYIPTFSSPLKGWKDEPTTSKWAFVMVKRIKK